MMPYPPAKSDGGSVRAVRPMLVRDGAQPPVAEPGREPGLADDGREPLVADGGRTPGLRMGFGFGVARRARAAGPPTPGPALGLPRLRRLAWYAAIGSVGA